MKLSSILLVILSVQYSHSFPTNQPSSYELEKLNQLVDIIYEESVFYTAKQERLNETISSLKLVHSLEVRERMADFATTMQSFVVDSTFQEVAFESNYISLRAELTDITSDVASLSPSKRLSTQLGCITRMFDVYTDCAEMLRHINKLREMGSRLLYKVVELNIRAMALHDSYGNLDSLCSNGSVNTLMKELSYWKERFENLKGVSLEIQSDFRIQYLSVENKLLYLYSFVPEGRR